MENDGKSSKSSSINSEDNVDDSSEASSRNDKDNMADNDGKDTSRAKTGRKNDTSIGTAADHLLHKGAKIIYWIWAVQWACC
eukprot:3991441-Ditylum_brightwellii.AAC.1